MLIKEAGGCEGRIDLAEGRGDQNYTFQAWGTKGNQLILETGTQTGQDEHAFGNEETPRGT